MLKKGMTGPLALWCDTSKPWPVKYRPVEYIPPINEALIKKLYDQVKDEKTPKLTGLKAQQRVERYEMKKGLIAIEGET